MFVDHTAKLGGGEIALRNLVNHLDNKRVCVEILLCEDGPLAAQLRERHPVTVLALSRQIAETRRGALGWGSLLNVTRLISVAEYVWRMSRHIRSAGVDVVHTNSLKAHVIGGLAARLAGRPVIWHLRDRIASDYLPRSVVGFVKLLGRTVPEFIIANSQATLDTLVKRDGDSQAQPFEHRACVVHDGCTIPSEPVKGTRPQTTAIGLIGRISPWKGQHVFIRAAAMIKDRFPDVRFQIIGSPLFSETEYDEQIKALARELGVERQVEFVGFVEDVQAATARLDIVVHASTIAEPFGQVVIEGMAAGKPVIATRGGGVLEILVEGVTGLLVPMDDPVGLAEAMTTLLSDQALARSMGERGKQRAREFFSIERTARAVEHVYAEVISGSHARPDLLASMATERADP